ncbi:Calx-beta domain-containing protein [uncultured Sulfitobacter sp.]|uniref:Calx-beta domain-containing protein n=1 Tax=uncultured Sulfitobacter sp. TaxID=191468 RepID=UPI00261CB105|nr:Calx-beta domain-containing protein [uncultured Sulfitobacter sp.]
MVEVTLSNASVEESYSGTLSFNVTLSEPALDVVTMTYRTFANGTANDFDLDYVTTSTRNNGTLTITPGETTGTIQIPISDDSTDEFDEAIVMELGNLSSNAEFQGGEQTLRNFGIILDQDGTGTNLALFVSDPVLVEGDRGTTEAVFDIQLSRPAETAFELQYTTRDLDATAGEDYTAAVGTIEVRPGQSVAQVRVAVTGDTSVEAAERFALVVTPPSSPIMDVTGSVGYALIQDDDSSPEPVVSIESVPVYEAYSTEVRFDVKLSQAPVDSVSMSFRTLTDQTVQDGDLDYPMTSSRTNDVLTFAPGQTSASIFIGLSNDNIDETDEAFTLELYNLSENASFKEGTSTLSTRGIIMDDDGVGPNLAMFVSDPVLIEADDGTQQATFEVQLSRPATSAFTVEYTTTDITATAGSDYTATSGSLTFEAGEDRAAVTVDVSGDVVAEQTETFALNLSAPANIALSTDGLSGVATVLDNDTDDGPVISFARADDVMESYSGSLRYVVSLSEASSEPVTVEYTTSLGSAQESDLDYGVTSTRNNGTLTFAPGETSASVYIGIGNDSIDERDESVFLTLSEPTGGVLAGGEARLTTAAFILDDDGLGLNVALSGPPISFQEPSTGSRLVEVPVFLSEASATELTFDVAVNGGLARAGSDFDLLDTTVTFAPGQTEAAVSVRLLSDAENEGLEGFNLNYAAQAGSTFAGTVLDQTGTLRNYATATEGDDRITGTDAPENLDGLGGNDFISGEGGNDTLRGSDGVDTINGGTGDDLIFGGGSRNDLRDVIFGGEGNDVIDGGYGNDELRGDAGDDNIAGGFGADTVLGGTGDDTLTGSALGDQLFGGDGDDFVNGGFGYDRVNGGGGADSFFHLGVEDHGSDWIQDYNSRDGDTLVFGNAAATRAQFQINEAFTPGAGAADVADAFIIYRPTGQIMWALVDGTGQDQINLSIGGEIFDLTA